MEKFLLKSFALFLLLPVIACQKVELEEVSGIDPNLIVRGSFHQYDNAKIAGTGAIRFNQGTTSNRHALTLKGSLEEAHTGSLAAHFYSNSANLAANNGLVISFVRNGANVNATIVANGVPYQVHADRLRYYFPASLDLVIEVHNTAPARVLIWRRDLLVYSPDTADVDTARAGDLTGGSLTQTGPGTFVGISLNLASVSAVTATHPQVVVF